MLPTKWNSKYASTEETYARQRPNEYLKPTNLKRGQKKANEIF